MAEVIIGFSAPKSFKIGAEAIKLWQGCTPYCHVYLRIYSNYTQQWLVYQASHGMVNCLLFTNFAAYNDIAAEFKLDLAANDIKDCIKKAQMQLGQPYGYLGLLKLVARRVLPFLAVIGDGQKSFHCSEFIARLFPDLAQKLNIDPDFIEPVHLYRELKDRAS